ncbi:MAG TPA: hypothetical protein VF525_14895 [Pyrinomonadaceae bacterium]|jgi:hypothetical protein
MHRLKRYTLGASLGVIMLHAVVAQTGADVARVQGLLSAARAALGGEEKLKNVQGLTASGKFRRVIAMRVGGDGGGQGAGLQAPPELAGDVELSFARPDKFLKQHEIDTPMGDSITEVVGLDAGQAWADMHSTGGSVVIMRRPAPAGGTGGGDSNQRVRAEFARYMLALLLNEPTDQAVAWSYAGEAEAEDGRADVLDCKGANGFNARLFLDKTSHRPLLLTYRSNEPVMRMMMRGGPPPKAGGAPKDAAKDVQANELPPPEMKETETEVRFGDYRAEDGIMWPHQLTFASDGTVNEEWEIKSYKVNPQFKADKFQKKGK